MFKTTFLNEKVNCTEPSPSVNVPCHLSARAFILGKPFQPDLAREGASLSLDYLSTVIIFGLF